MILECFKIIVTSYWPWSLRVGVTCPGSSLYSSFSSTINLLSWTDTHVNATSGSAAIVISGGGGHGFCADLSRSVSGILGLYVLKSSWRPVGACIRTGTFYWESLDILHSCWWAIGASWLQRNPATCRLGGFQDTFPVGHKTHRVIHSFFSLILGAG